MQWAVAAEHIKLANANKTGCWKYKIKVQKEGVTEKY